MKTNELIRCGSLSKLCEDVRALTAKGDYEQCDKLIRQAMAEYPSAPQPHNLMGVVLEKLGDHTCAMKHFRAAWALDATYTPASQNLTTYGTFCATGNVAYDECDCPPVEDSPYTVVYDDKGVGHVVRRK